MAKHETTSQLIRYDDDYCAWLSAQIGLLEARRLSDLDLPNLIEELKGLIISQKHAIDGRLVILLQHLLKWEFQPEERSNSWRASILEHRQRINRLIEDSPSLRRYPSQRIDKEYRIARLKAAGDTGLPLSRFPSTCPYTASQILDEDFWPGVEWDTEE